MLFTVVFTAFCIEIIKLIFSNRNDFTMLFSPYTLFYIYTSILLLQRGNIWIFCMYVCNIFSQKLPDRFQKLFHHQKAASSLTNIGYITCSKKIGIKNTIMCVNPECEKICQQIICLWNYFFTFVKLIKVLTIIKSYYSYLSIIPYPIK